MKKIFYDTDNIWKGFEAPEKEYYMMSSPFAILDGKSYFDKKGYNRAYAAARATALPILNPELITTKDLFKWHPDITSYGQFLDGKDYNWPGEWEIVAKEDMMSAAGLEDGLLLSLPANETGKTAEEIAATKRKPHVLNVDLTE